MLHCRVNLKLTPAGYWALICQQGTAFVPVPRAAHSHRGGCRDCIILVVRQLSCWGETVVREFKISTHIPDHLLCKACFTADKVRFSAHYMKHWSSYTHFQQFPIRPSVKGQTHISMLLQEHQIRHDRGSKEANPLSICMHTHGPCYQLPAYWLLGPCKSRINVFVCFCRTISPSQRCDHNLHK